LKLRVGYELQYEFPQPTPLIHFSRVADLAAPDHIVIIPLVPISCYHDGFGNWCSGILACAGHVRLSTDAVVTDSGQFDPVVPDAGQIAVEKLPEEALVFFLASRFESSWKIGIYGSTKVSPMSRTAMRSGVSRSAAWKRTIGSRKSSELRRNV
jgi:hypothetical protein